MNRIEERVGDLPQTVAAQTTNAGRFRWTICLLLFLATTSNYMDRQVMGILAPKLKDIFHWDEIQYGYIVTAFQASYAVGLLLFGGLMDRIGTKRGYGLSVTLWSVAACGHAFTSSIGGFGVARVALGLSEAGNFPAAIKTVAEWFPKRERALATGLFNSGANVGAILAPALVPWLTLTYGWQAAFLMIGALGFLWVVLWMKTYSRPEEHPAVSSVELATIRSDADAAEPNTVRLPWSRLLGFRQTWAFVAAKFLTDPIWWFYLYWLPKFLNERHGLDLGKLGAPLIVVYMMSSVGSVGGGWLSGQLLRCGWSANRSRKAVFLLCALCVVPIIAASIVPNFWQAVLLIGLAAAAHQGWSATLFTTASDMFPKRAVGSVTGIGGMAGSVGGMLFAAGTGWLLTATHNNYQLLFVIAGSAYLTALGLFSLLVPRIEPIDV